MQNQSDNTQSDKGFPFNGKLPKNPNEKKPGYRALDAAHRAAGHMESIAGYFRSTEDVEYKLSIKIREATWEAFREAINGGNHAVTKAYRAQGYAGTYRCVLEMIECTDGNLHAVAGIVERTTAMATRAIVAEEKGNLRKAESECDEAEYETELVWPYYDRASDIVGVSIRRKPNPNGPGEVWCNPNITREQAEEILKQESKTDTTAKKNNQKAKLDFGM